MNILVINCGSSSIKFAVLHLEGGSHRSVLTGLLERIGQGQGLLRLSAMEALPPQAVAAADHREAFAAVFAALGRHLADVPLAAVGHRVVHGGTAFSEAALIDEGVIAAIRQLIPLARLHNPVNLLGIEICRAAFPQLPQVAVFDTAFHQTLPSHAYRYAVPADWYRDLGIRRYGFHGTAHQYLVEQAQAHCGRPLNLITLHLGNGASACAVRQGRCVDTSMGFTPLEGLVMGTRSGDLDPAAALFAAGRFGIERTETALLHDSGMQGLCGSNDLRDILQRAQAGDEPAQLALDLYCYRVRKYLGAYFAVLGSVDAVVFSGGVGENAAEVRVRICDGLDSLGLHLDRAVNLAPPDCGVAELQAAGSTVRVFRIRANEELAIARQTALVAGGSGCGVDGPAVRR